MAWQPEFKFEEAVKEGSEIWFCSDVNAIMRVLYTGSKGSGSSASTALKQN